ncbi:hypothetical protein TNCV_4929871 [Trichonephila clavipes]|nr:hypothetical protein TNCV_4929871 [Trichonephila clavipes]
MKWKTDCEELLHLAIERVLGHCENNEKRGKFYDWVKVFINVTLCSNRLTTDLLFLNLSQVTRTTPAPLPTTTPRDALGPRLVFDSALPTNRQIILNRSICSPHPEENKDRKFPWPDLFLIPSGRHKESDGFVRQVKMSPGDSTVYYGL